MHTVVVTDHDFEDLSIERGVLDGVAELRELSADPGDRGPTIPRDADALLVLRRPIDAADLDRLGDCRIVARYGIGVDGVAVDTATDRGVHVTNVPDYCVEEVATHALTLGLCLYRDVARYDADVAAGGWDRTAAPPIHRFSTRTVGVVGYGAIGRAFGERAAALGGDVIAFDPFLDPEDVADTPADLVEFDALLDRSDLISIHAPLSDDTRGLFDAGAFDRMRDDAVLVNVARGGVVDGDALRAAVEAGTIGGAGLDVLATEPPAADDPLRDHERAVVTPHVAWYSEEANAERRRRAAENVRAALRGATPPDAVNAV
jgi:D-3-phosphoglycerate dehydrogenase